MGHARTRVLVAGLGDAGLLTAIALARHADLDVVGVSTRPGLVSGQELGLRLARPEVWARDYRVTYDRFRGLDRVEVVHGRLVGAHLAAGAVDGTVDVERADGSRAAIGWDVLVIATGVGNGFWRSADLLTPDAVDTDLRERHARLAAARSVLVVGGGAAAVSSALQIARRWPGHEVTLAFPGQRGLPRHAERTWATVRGRLEAAGVVLQPGRRAVVPAGTRLDALGPGEVAWQDGAPSSRADAVLWAIGRTTPHTDWLPADVLDSDGFVRVGPTLQVPGHPRVLAVGDVAATDALRTSARNRADRLAARNVRALLDDRPLAAYRPRERRWGSVLGLEHDGLRVFTPGGRCVRIPARAVDAVLQPLIVRRGIYGGVRGG